jgi:hypothetical protein
VQDKNNDKIQKMKTRNQIQKEIKKLKIHGFGGNCGNAAMIYNEKIFGGKAKYVIAANKFIFEKFNSVVGHVALEYNGDYWDSDGIPKEREDIESWGMLDEADFSNYIEDYSEQSGQDYNDFEYSEDDPYEVIWLENLTREQINEYIPPVCEYDED